MPIATMSSGFAWYAGASSASTSARSSVGWGSANSPLDFGSGSAGFGSSGAAALSTCRRPRSRARYTTNDEPMSETECHASALSDTLFTNV